MRKRGLLAGMRNCRCNVGISEVLGARLER